MPTNDARGSVAEDAGQLLDLSEKTAIVTGGSKGIGAAIAARLAAAGARVTIADLDPEGDVVARDIGGRFRRCDVADTGALTAMIEDASAGGLDILVNNAGIMPTTGPLAEVEDSFVSRMLDVNVRAQFSATREAARRMNDGGSIVNMASVAAIRGGAGISAYAASKAAVVALTRAAASELGARRIRVNAVAPGIIDTPGVREQLAPLKATGLDVERQISANLLRVGGRPDHIARVVLFLVSDLAAFMTGQLVVADGGSLS